ncbi:MAG: sigma-70 family RNA polymerase sigma factor [Puia sp.]|nr:sigma-70 family RNA polymerase sigma factor [Puia sp.]
MSESAGNHISSVISRFGKRLQSFIRRRVDTDADAEDVLQDVWYQLTAAVDTEPIEQVSSWLFTVARNKITDRYRKKKPASLEDLLTPDEEHLGNDFRDILLDTSSNPETELLRGIFWKALQDALRELPEEQRNVFIWHELEDIPFKEIAEKSGTPVNTLISRKRYAVLHLRERLQTIYDEIINT